MLKKITLEACARSNAWTVYENTGGMERRLGICILYLDNVEFFPRDGQQLDAICLADLADFCDKQTKWIMSGKRGLHSGAVKPHKKGGK